MAGFDQLPEAENLHNDLRQAGIASMVVKTNDVFHVVVEWSDLGRALAFYFEGDFPERFLGARVSTD